MPAKHEFKCLECGRAYVITVKFGDEVPNTPCPICHSNKVKKVFNTAFILKGEGYYSTDNRNGKG